MDSAVNPPENRRGLNRRTFMKLSAAAGALATAGGIAQVEADDDCGPGVEGRWRGLLHQFGVFDTGGTKG